MSFACVCVCVCVCVDVPVRRRGKQSQDDVPALHAYDVAGGVEQVEVEVRVSRDGAVQPGLQERSPLLLQHTLGAPEIPLTHTSHPGQIGRAHV